MKTLSDFKRRIIPGVKLDTKHLQTGWSPGVRSIGTVGATQFSLSTKVKNGETHQSFVSFPKASEFTVVDENTAIFHAPWLIDGKEQVVPLLQYTFIDEEIMDDATQEEPKTAGTLEPLTGHTTEETAYIIQDYPWGYKLRCKQKVWLEYNKSKGFRVCRRTQDPRNDRWCAIKKDTYTLIAAGLYKNEEGHVKSAGLSEYSSTKDSEEFLKTWGFCLDEVAMQRLTTWIIKKRKYDEFVANKKAGTELVMILKSEDL